MMTLLTGIGLKFCENILSINAENKRAALAINAESRRFQLALLDKTASSSDPNSALNTLDLIQAAGLIDTQVINWNKVRLAVLGRTEKKRLDSVSKSQLVIITEKKSSLSDTVKSNTGVAKKNISPNIQSEGSGEYIIIAGGDVTFDAAQYEKKRAEYLKFPDVRIVYRKNSYRTCIGNYKSYSDAIVGLLFAKDKLNDDAYLVRSNSWCPNPVLNSKGYYECK